VGLLVYESIYSVNRTELASKKYAKLAKIPQNTTNTGAVVARPQKNRVPKNLALTQEAWDLATEKARQVKVSRPDWIENLILSQKDTTKEVHRTENPVNDTVDSEIESFASALAALVGTTDPEAIALVQVRLRAFAVALVSDGATNRGQHPWPPGRGD